MSSVVIKGNASGTGSVTIESPNTNSDYTVILPAASGTLGAGDVGGPASATDNAVARFDGTTGKLIQDSSFIVNDSGEVTTGVWQGTAISVDKGGTGRTTLTANNVLLGNGTSAVNFVAPGTNGNVLTSNGTTWTSTAPSGGVTSVNGQTGAVVTTDLDAIGSYIMAYYARTNVTASHTRYSYVAVGSTIAGSSLRYGNGADATNVTTAPIPVDMPFYMYNPSAIRATGNVVIATTTTFPTTGTTTLSGTWRKIAGRLDSARVLGGCGPDQLMWMPSLWVRVS
jgi:hypothetical protein